MKPGTLVMYKPNVKSVLRGVVPSGAIGEVLPHQPNWSVRFGNVVVLFERHRSNHDTGSWSIPMNELVPLNDPDIDLTEETEDNLNKEFVTES